VTRAYVLFTNPDYRAAPIINEQMQAPALHGACDQCEVVGVRFKGDSRTIYPGHYRSAILLKF
jgi:hypothetical protein